MSKRPVESTGRSSLRPTRRPLQIYAFDPTIDHAAHAKANLDVVYEELSPGPTGSRVRVVDYDGARKGFYPPVDLNQRDILLQGGLPPSEANPQFHQQMVYAVAMKVIESFEIALGRRIRFYHGKPLTILPHAFQGKNAFYDPKTRALYFGYFRADRKDPGPNLPGQIVFTCLSNNIICHEVTHALLHVIRPHSLEATNSDVLAFHEAIADIVAVFQHFCYPEVVKQALRATHGQLDAETLLSKMGSQFGFALGRGRALRSAQSADPTMTAIHEVKEEHARGEILLRAVFRAALEIYRKRSEDTFRISSLLSPPGADLHPDILQRLVTTASGTAKSVLTMCLRALDYLPSIDITFGDYLRALVTADRELWPVDPLGQRTILINCFRQFGILPEGVVSLSEESLVWPSVEGTNVEAFPADLVAELLASEAKVLRRGRRDRPESPLASPAGLGNEAPDDAISKAVAKALHHYAMDNHIQFQLQKGPGVVTQVQSFHPMIRRHEDGIPSIEMAVVFAQRLRKESRAPEDVRLAGLRERGGSTIIARGDGTVRYVIAKPIGTVGDARFARTAAWIEDMDRRDPMTPWRTSAEVRHRHIQRTSLRSIDQGRMS